MVSLDPPIFTRVQMAGSPELGLELGQTLSDLLGNIKVLYILRSILLSSRGVDGRGGLPPRQSSLVLLGIRCEVVCVCVCQR